MGGPAPAPAAVTLSTAVLSWPQSPGFRAGLCLPGPLQGRSGGSQTPIPQEVQSLGTRGGRLCSVEATALVLRVNICVSALGGGHPGRRTPHLLRQAWTRSAARPRTTLLVWGSMPGSTCDLS